MGMVTGGSTTAAVGAGTDALSAPTVAFSFFPHATTDNIARASAADLISYCFALIANGTTVFPQCRFSTAESSSTIGK